MDTDELSNELYKVVILEAGEFHEDLMLRFGLLASECDSESEYLLQAKLLVKEIGKLSNARLQDVFFSQPPKKESLALALGKIMAGILAVEEIPENERHYDF